MKALKQTAQAFGLIVVLVVSGYGCEYLRYVTAEVELTTPNDTVDGDVESEDIEAQTVEDSALYDDQQHVDRDEE